MLKQGGFLMSNRLPEKLTALRKHFSYSLADVAEKVQVPVQEYMNWENGNKICHIEQLQKLAAFYSVPIRTLLDNTKEVELPELEETYSTVDIPFKDSINNGTAKEPDYRDKTVVEIEQEPQFEQTTVTPIVEDDNIEHTRLISTGELEQTLVQQIVEDEPEVKKPKKKVVSTSKPTKTSPKISPKVLMAIGGALLLLLLGFLGINWLRNRGGLVSNNLSKVNRVALADRYTVYIDDSGNLVTSGEVPSLSDFTNIVQVSTSGSGLLGLKKDGSVVCTGAGTACEVNDWKNITMVAAGTRHSVGLTNKGTVECVGTDRACSVKDWENIEAVYAGNEVTIGKTNEDKLLIAGKVSSQTSLETLENVEDVTIGENQIVVLFKDGTVLCYGIEGNVVSNTGSWTNITKAVSGRNFAVGLNNNKKVVVATTNDTLKKDTEEWSDISYIAARGDTIVAIKNGKIIGVGDNTYGQYGKEEEVEPSASPDAKLSKVTNIRFTPTKAGLTIQWDAVPNANYYEITVNTSPITSIKAAKNSASIGSNQLTDGATYTFTFTPHANDSSKYEAGETVRMDYKYEASLLQLGKPENVSAKQNGNQLTVSWNKVENADYYNVAIESLVQAVDGTNLTLDASSMENGKTYNIFVTAMSRNTSKYAESDAGTTSFTYEAPVVVQPLKVPTINDFGNTETNDLEINFTAVEHADHYEVIFNGQTYTTTTPTYVVSTVGLVYNRTYPVTVRAIPSDTKTYAPSEDTKNYDHRAPEPTPTPVPDPTATPEPTPDGGN